MRRTLIKNDKIIKKTFILHFQYLHLQFWKKLNAYYFLEWGPPQEGSYLGSMASKRLQTPGLDHKAAITDTL